MKELNIDVVLPSYDYWLRKNWYYHAYLLNWYQFIIPKHTRVLHIGSKTGTLLNAISPSLAVGIEHDEQLFIKAKINNPSYFFYHSLADIPDKTTFDYIVISSIIMEVHDIQHFLLSLKPYCTNSTRIIIDSYSPLWEPLLWLAQKFGFRRKTNLTNWVSRHDIQHFLMLSNFQTISTGRMMLIPFYIPLISWFINTFIGNLPGINRLCLIEWLVARSEPIKNTQNSSVSIIVPCKNERGNIESIVQQCPEMGSATEIIFIEGNSHDGTLDEIKRVTKEYAHEKKHSLFYSIR